MKSTSAPLKKHRPGPLGNYELYLGYACNRNCRFCFVEKKDRRAFSAPLSYREICGNLYSARAKGFRSLALLGGEPTLNRDLAKIIRSAKRLGYERVLLFSNGIRLADAGCAGELVSAGLDAVNLNIPSHVPGVFERLTRSPGGFALLLKALGNLAALKTPVSAVCVLNKLNHAALPEYAGFYGGLGIRVFTLQHMKFQGNVSSLFMKGNPDINALKVSMTDCAPGIKAMTRYCLDNALYPPFVEHMVPCVLKNYESRLLDFHQAPSRTGNYLCLHPDGVNSATWDIAYKDRVRLPVCAACVHSPRCYGIEKNYLKVYGGSEFKAVRSQPVPFYARLRGAKLKLAKASIAEGMAL